MQLTANFSIAEFTKSETAERLSLRNARSHGLGCKIKRLGGQLLPRLKKKAGTA